MSIRPCLAVVVALLLSGTAAAAGGDGKWLAELTGGGGTFTAYPGPLGWQADHPESYPQPMLVIGVRPAGDKISGGEAVRGKKHSDGDWVVSDGSGAVWVTGLPAPESGKRVAFSGRFTTEGGLAIKGIRYLVVASERKGMTVAHPGDFVYYPLAGNKSTTVPVEIDGDAAAVAFTDERDTLIVRAIQPGTARIRFLSRFFLDNEVKADGEAVLTVK
jgi:hypothetical protein